MKLANKLAILLLILCLPLFLAANAEALNLWASDSNLHGFSTLFELDPTTGEVLNSIDGPGTFADALSFAPDGQSIFVLDSSPGVVTESDIFQIDLDGTLLNSFYVPLDAEGLTILADGTLVVGGGESNTVAFVDPTSGAIQDQFSTPAAAPWGLCGLSSDGSGNIFGLTIDGFIQTYDLDGNLLASLDTGINNDTTLGLAFTGSSFFFSGTTSATIYEVDLVGNLLNSFAAPGAFTEGLDFPDIQAQVPGPVPEPATMLLLGSGLLGLATFRRKFKKS